MFYNPRPRPLSISTPLLQNLHFSFPASLPFPTSPFDCLPHNANSTSDSVQPPRMLASESTVSTRENGGGNEEASSNESGGTAYSAKGWRRAKRAAEEESFAEWLRRYSAGTIGPSDQMPKPPPAVLAILRERDGGYDVPSLNGSSSTTATSQLDAVPRLFREDPVSSSGNLSHGSSEQSSVGSGTSTSATSHSSASVSDADAEATALLEHSRRHGTFPAPPGPWEEERLKLTRKYGLDQTTRRKAVDRMCNRESVLQNGNCRN